MENKYKLLTEVNRTFIEHICKYLWIETEIVDSSSLMAAPGKTERLISYCKQLDGREYVSGPSARNYIDESLFELSGIKLRYYEYPPYKEYRQLSARKNYNVSVLDLLFNCGPSSKDFLE